jgi:hypothetical protein
VNKADPGVAKVEDQADKDPKMENNARDEDRAVEAPNRNL